MKFFMPHKVFKVPLKTLFGMKQFHLAARSPTDCEDFSIEKTSLANRGLPSNNTPSEGGWVPKMPACWRAGTIEKKRAFFQYFS
jgi:hypothetical protein